MTAYRSCGFYINGSKKPITHCSGFTCDTTMTACSNTYNTSVGCTNTTYKDAGGNAEGSTVFVAQNCSNGFLRPPAKQDARYANAVLDVGRAFVQYSEADGQYPSAGGYWPIQESPGKATCDRGCECSYVDIVPESQGLGTLPYSFCNCSRVIPELFVNLNTECGSSESPVYLTPTNISVFDFYGAYTSSVGQWEQIPDGDNRTLSSDFQCFGNYSDHRQLLIDTFYAEYLPLEFPVDRKLKDDR